MESGKPRLAEHLEKLRHFVSAVEAGSLSGGAQAMHLTQPTISHSIKVLEGILGSALLLRTSRGVKLTATGRLLFGEGKKLLEHCHRIEASIGRQRATALTAVRIGTKEPFAVHLFPDYLRRLGEREPPLSVS